MANSIEAMPTFQKDGKFDFDLYQQLLRSSRLTPKDFEEGQKRDLLLSKARQAIKDKAAVSDDEALAQYKKENDKIELEYVSYCAERGDRRGETDRRRAQRLSAEKPERVQDA